MGKAEGCSNRIEKDIAPGLPPVKGDRVQLQQVLLNLGANAIKFTDRGQVVIGARVTAVSASTMTLHFWVQDSGIGISQDHQAQIFSGFSQAEASTTRRFGGTGLGLSISRRFVQLMGGDIALQSEMGAGSTFVVGTLTGWEPPTWWSAWRQRSAPGSSEPGSAPARPPLPHRSG